jgi:hypothetical protein
MSGDGAIAFGCYNWSTMVTSIILVASYSICLKVIQSWHTSVPFVTTVIILMIISNVGAFLIIPSNMWLY